VWLAKSLLGSCKAAFFPRQLAQLGFQDSLSVSQHQAELVDWSFRRRTQIAKTVGLVRRRNRRSWHNIPITLTGDGVLSVNAWFRQLISSVEQYR
jgi:hypothetical protein